MKYFLIAMLIFNNAVAQQRLGIIELTNPLSSAVKETVIEIPFNDIIKQTGNVSTENIVIKDSRNKELVCQWIKDGRETPQSLLVQIDIPAGKKIVLSIQHGKPASFKATTFGRFVPERYDDFAWENDKVAFRMYGPALQSRPDNAYGIDVWSKRTSELVIDKWYKLNDYHRDNGEGQDYYNVGFTLGAGDMAPYINDSIIYSKNYATYKVLDNGPLRTCFELTYTSWNVGNDKVQAVKKISLDAGSQLNKIQVTYNITGADSLPVVIGIIKRTAPGSLNLDEKKGIMSYWEPQMGSSGITGIGCIFNGSVKTMLVSKQQLLARTSIHNNKPFIYYTGAAWNKAGIITSATDWNNYLYTFQNLLLNPIKFIIK